MAYTSAASWPSLPSKLISPPSLLQALTSPLLKYAKHDPASGPLQ